MEIIHTEHAPAAIGPYSQAIAHCALVFTSGQLPIDPATGSFPEGGIEAQAEQSIADWEQKIQETAARADALTDVDKGDIARMLRRLRQRL